MQHGGTPTQDHVRRERAGMQFPGFARPAIQGAERTRHTVRHASTGSVVPNAGRPGPKSRFHTNGLAATAGGSVPVDSMLAYRPRGAAARRRVACGRSHSLTPPVNALAL